MYYGHPISERQRLSKDEKDLIRSRKERDEEERRIEHENYMAKHKEFMRRGGNAVGGDSGDDGGGGDGD
jgi:hypothetical protein